MRWAPLLCVVVACVSPDLVPCGELTCPAGAVCYGGELCVTSDQLTACANSADGDPCTADSVAGTCVGGLCISGRCGNHVVELGEVCDDGNRISGDGCREDCLSDEQCGNGLLDLGETCDCGDSADNKPAYCSAINDEALTAECNTTCTRRCGDGLVTGSEQCDGANVPLDCGDFGYYVGSTTCTPACTLDRSACSGSCGDNVVQANFGEQCDGSPPVEQSCISYGFDAGQVTCNDLCAPDLAHSCEQFGWEPLFRVDALTDDIEDATANARAVVGVRPSGAVMGIWDGVAFTHDGSYRLAVAADAFVGAAGDTVLSRFDGSTWTDTALTAPPIAIEATREGTVYLLHADCSIDRLATTSDSLAAPGTQCLAMKVFSDDEIYVSARGQQLWKWDGQAWTVPDYSPTQDWGEIYFIAKHGQSLVLGAGLPYDVATDTSLINRTVYGIATSGDVVVVATEEFPAIIPDEQWMHLDFVDGDESFGRINSMRNTPDGQVIGWGAGVYRLHTSWTQLGAAAEVPYLQAVTVSPTGHIFSCGRHAYEVTTGTSYGDTPTICNGLFESHTQLVEADAQGIYHWDGTEFSQDADVRAHGGFVDDASNDVYILTDDDVVRRHEDGTLTSLDAPAGCVWSLISAVDAATIFIAGECDSAQHYYRYTAGAWSEIATPFVGLSSMYVSPDGQIFGSTGDNPFDAIAVHWNGTSWEQWPFLGTQVAGLSASDVYFVGGGNDHGIPVLHRWNGTALETVRLDDGATGQSAIGAGEGQIAVARSGRVDVLIPIHP